MVRGAPQPSDSRAAPLYWVRCCPRTERIRRCGDLPSRSGFFRNGDNSAWGDLLRPCCSSDRGPASASSYISLSRCAHTSDLIRSRRARQPTSNTTESAVFPRRSRTLTSHILTRKHRLQLVNASCPDCNSIPSFPIVENMLSPELAPLLAHTRELCRNASTKAQRAVAFHRKLVQETIVYLTPELEAELDFCGCLLNAGALRPPGLCFAR